MTFKEIFGKLVFPKVSIFGVECYDCIVNIAYNILMNEFRDKTGNYECHFNVLINWIY